MGDWELLNGLQRSVYLGEGNGSGRNELNRLISAASNSDDIEFLKSVLTVKEDFDSVNSKRKLLWLTSKVRGEIYAPFPVGIAGPLPWNGGSRLVNHNSSYCLEKPLKASEDVAGISQCKDLENCSLVATIISMKANQVEGPPIRKISNDMYHVNLHFNGCEHRLVSVCTSKVPTDMMGNQLSICSSDMMDKVVEMAYLQVKAGSYATKGSNSAMDTYMLSGYVPEVKSTRNHISMENLIEFYQSGACLLAVGTGRQSSGLHPSLMKNHDYPVVAADSERQTIVLQDPLDPLFRTEVSLEALTRNYQQLYINWCTRKLFTNEKTVVFFYNVDKYNCFNTVMGKPIFSLKNKSNAAQNAWLLLESHLQSEKAIAYLQELPTNVLSTVGAPHEGACDIGLQLLKLRVPPNSTTNLFCHSSTSNAFTLHLYTNSHEIIMSRSAAEKYARIIYFSAHDLLNSFIGSPFYYKNPTFKVEINSPDATKQVTVTFQLLSKNPEDMINLQVYHLNDHSFQKPIFADTNYTQQRYDKRFILLSSNVPYKLVCSSYSPQPENAYKLQVSPSDDPSLLPNIRIQQIYMQFGGLPYQIEKKIKCTQEETCIPIFTVANNTSFIRVVPPTLSRLVQMRCTVLNDSGTFICGTQDFQPPSPGGIVLDNCKLQGPSNNMLVIEYHSPKTELDSKTVTLVIGSSKKITIDEGFC